MNVTVGGRYLPPNPLFSHPMWGAVMRALAPPPAAPVLPRHAQDTGGETWGGQGLNLGPPPTYYSPSYDVGGQQVTPPAFNPGAAIGGWQSHPAMPAQGYMALGSHPLLASILRALHGGGLTY